MLVAAADSDREPTIEAYNADGTTITALQGSTAAEQVTTQFPEATLAEFPQQDAAFLEVASGRADAIVVESYLAERFIQANPDQLAIVGLDAPLQIEFGAYAIPLGDDMFLTTSTAGCSTTRTTARSTASTTRSSAPTRTSPSGRVAEQVTGPGTSNVSIVTGAGSGIGRAVAIALGARGDIVVCADIDEASAAETSLGRRRFGVAARLDVTDADVVRRAVRAASSPTTAASTCSSRAPGIELGAPADAARRRRLAAGHRRQPQRHVLVRPRRRAGDDRRRRRRAASC